MAEEFGRDATESFAESLLDQSPDMAYVIDPEGHFRWWNARVREVTGYDDAELDGVSAFDLVPEYEYDRLTAAFDGIDEYGWAEPTEFDILTRGGERMPHEFRGAVVRDETGAATAITGIARSIERRKKREARLRRQRDELDTLYRINETVDGVIRALVDAGTRDGIEQMVCETLVASDLYQGVWIGRTDGGPTVEPTTASGTVDEFVDVVNEFGTRENWQRPAARAHELNRSVVVQNVPAPETDLPAAVKAAAERLGIRAGTSVPVHYRETVYGVLTVYSPRPNAFSTREREAFRRLGGVIGFAINAVQARRLLLSESVIELEFELTDSDAVLTRVTAERGGTCRLEWATPTEDGRVRAFYAVEGIDTETIEAGVAETPHTHGFRVVSATGEKTVVELTYDRSAVRRLMDAGASPRALEITDGTTRVVAEAPQDADVREMVEGFFSVYDDARLVAKRVVDRPVGGTTAVAATGDCELTERQREVLSLAFSAGYFHWPRGSTAEEVAERLNISSATFHYHLRAAQETLIASYLGR